MPGLSQKGNIIRMKVNRCLFLFFSAVNRQLTGGGEERRTLTACQPFQHLSRHYKETILWRERERGHDLSTSTKKRSYWRCVMPRLEIIHELTCGLRPHQEVISWPHPASTMDYISHLESFPMSPPISWTWVETRLLSPKISCILTVA